MSQPPAALSLDVDAFQTMVSKLMAEAAAYAGRGVWDEQMDQEIRVLRVLSAGLNAALQATATVPRPPVSLPAPAPLRNPPAVA